jgi:hypothetical protein
MPEISATSSVKPVKKYVKFSPEVQGYALTNDNDLFHYILLSNISFLVRKSWVILQGKQ